jgi:hypothetical protein
MTTNVPHPLIHKKYSIGFSPSLSFLLALFVVMIGCGLNAYGLQATGNGINYQGGPVMQGPHNVYFIWYGNWSGNSALNLIPQFIQNLSNSPYFSVNTTYGDSSRPLRSMSSSVTMMSQTFDNYSHGANLGSTGIQDIVTSTISGGSLPADPNGIYFVLTSKDVTEPGFCATTNGFCGYHNYAVILGTGIKYAFVGDSTTQCYSTCATLVSNVTPNGNPGADAMINDIAHELSETVTDPQLNAWIDYGEFGGGENADKCDNDIEPFFSTPNGALANLTLGGVNYMVQKLWINDGGGKCAMASTGSAFLYAGLHDKYYGCHGIASRSVIDCSNIADTNDSQICQAIVQRNQNPCSLMTDRNLQLSCYGMALAPQFPSNCRDITNPQMQAFCYGVSSGGSNAYTPNCSALVDADTRALCNAMALNDSSYCSSINDSTDRQFCRGVSAQSPSECAPISSCPDINAQESCLNTGGTWDWNSCSCSFPPCGQQITCAQSPGPLPRTVQLKSKDVLQGVSTSRISKKQ